MKYTENDHKYALRKANKIKAINLLGGKCEICGEINPIFLEFHHKQKNKEKSISQVLDSRWSTFIVEVKKCELLCSNCHSEKHCPNSGRRSISKNLLLEKISTFCCSRCGYSGGNYSSLDFHHVDKSNKKFSISKNLKEMTISDLMDETVKCVIMCKNCHKLEHFDTNRFDKMQDLIHFKIKNHKEKPKEYNKKLIWSLYSSGKKQSEIVKIIGCKSGTLSYIIKVLKQKHKWSKNDE